MPAACPICSHDSRLAIEQAILNGKSLSSIARTFGYTYTRGSDGRVMPEHKVIQRHRDRCMPDAYATAVKERTVESGTAIAARLAELDAEVDKVIQAANKGRPVMIGDIPMLDPETGEQVMVHDWRLLLFAVAQGRANAELAAKLTGRVEADPADLAAARAHLETPEGRRLLAKLEELAAQADDVSGGRSG